VVEVPWVSIETLPQYVDKRVEIRGWLANKRSSGKITFLILRDGTGFLQATAFAGEHFDSEEVKSLKRIPLESSLIARGKVKEEKKSHRGL
jgi:asparaginyl-tRNA synthetase